MNTLTVLSALAQIQDIKDFRLRDFMSKLGLDERQPSTFYRKLLKESRDAMRLLDDLQNRLGILEKAKSQMETELVSQKRQIGDLKTKTSSVENENQQRINKLESENRQLKAIASQLQEKAENYDALKALLQAQIDTTVLGSLFHSIYDVYMEQLHAEGEQRPPSDTTRVCHIIERLREDLMKVLEIPRDKLEEKLTELEQKLRKAEEQNKTMTSIITQVFTPRG